VDLEINKQKSDHYDGERKRKTGQEGAREKNSVFQKVATGSEGGVYSPSGFGLERKEKRTITGTGFYLEMRGILAGRGEPTGGTEEKKKATRMREEKVH